LTNIAEKGQRSSFMCEYFDVDEDDNTATCCRGFTY